MASFCSSCGAAMPEGTTVCSACGKSSALPPAGSSAGGLDDNIAALLAYLFIPAIIFLVMEPYNRNRFIRFHSFQSLFLALACFVISTALGILMSIPVLGLLVIPLWFIYVVGVFILWVLLVIKAYQGQKFKLPVIGDMAEKQANNV